MIAIPVLVAHEAKEMIGDASAECRNVDLISGTHSLIVIIADRIRQNDRMSLPIHVNSYPRYKANERPRQFVLDDEVYELGALLDLSYPPLAHTSRSEQSMAT